VNAATRPHALVFGLSADPPHNGHVQVVQAACRWLKQQDRTPTRILIVPVGKINPINGKYKASASFWHRFHMCQRAFEPLVGSSPYAVQIMDIEWQRIQAGCAHNTTWDTLNTLAHTHLWHESVTLLLSADHFASDNPAFFRWHRWQELMARADGLIASRPGYHVSETTWAIVQKQAGDAGRQWQYLQTSTCAIASRQIRQWLNSQDALAIKKAKSFLPETVFAYVADNALYGLPEKTSR